MDHKTEIATALSGLELFIADMQEQGIEPLAIATAMLLGATNITKRISGERDAFAEWRREVVK